MKIDLQKVKTEIESELQQLETRRSTLQEQMAHLEAVQQIAGELAGPDKVDGTQADDQAKVPGAAAAGTG